MISLQYTAGFLDGEGSVGVSVSKSTAGYPVPSLRLTFSNMDKRPLEMIKHRWGGSLSGPNENEVYALHVNGKVAYSLLKDVVPYCIVKKELVTVAIAFHSVPFEGPDNNPLAYIHKCESALRGLEETRKGYRATRSTKMMDKLKEAIAHVREQTGITATAN